MSWQQIGSQPTIVHLFQLFEATGDFAAPFIVRTRESRVRKFVPHMLSSMKKSTSILNKLLDLKM